jgi:hypothetical protein
MESNGSYLARWSQSRARSEDESRRVGVGEKEEATIELLMLEIDISGERK